MATVKNIRALIGFSNVADADVVQRGTAVQTNMTGNSNFPNPPVDLNDFKSKLDAFAAAIADAKDGGKKAITLRDHLGGEIVRLMKLLAFYAELNCKEDMNIFLTSGFTPRSTTRTPPQPVAPTTVLSVDQGESGSFKVWMQAVRRAKNYQVRKGQVGVGGATPTSWDIVTVPNTKNPAVITGLTPGTTYAIQVRAYGTLGYSEWSDSSVRMAL